MGTTVAEADAARTDWAARTGTDAELDIGIEGMTCASCARRVEKALQQVPGVSAVAVNLATERAHVAFEGKPGTAAALVAAVGNAGYGTPTIEFDLDVQGMTCASCVGRVERVLKRVPGVVAAEVNLATERARAVAVSGTVTAEQLAAAVREAGYEARPTRSTEETAPEQDAAAARSRRNLACVAAAAALSAPLLAGMIGHFLGFRWMLPG